MIIIMTENEFHMMAENFGAQLYDAEQDKLVFDKTAILKTLKYLHDLNSDMYHKARILTRL
ncbi:hypothetical protein M1N12_01785 [Peptococcaceae bacterium]|nr:hypothetical protein [Peptococcaceae bacterium]